MSKIGRNDPCPCGSGRKYKQCCLGKTKELLGGGPGPESPTLGLDWHDDGLSPPPQQPKRQVIDLMAPTVAHAFPIRERRAGRGCFDRGAVRDAACEGLRYSAWVLDEGGEYHASLNYPRSGDSDRSIDAECSCAVNLSSGMCRHIYAMLLHHDAQAMGDRRGQVVDPLDYTAVLAERLRQADAGHAGPDPGQLSRRAQDIAVDVESMAEAWAESHQRRISRDPSGYDEWLELQSLTKRLTHGESSRLRRARNRQADASQRGEAVLRALEHHHAGAGSAPSGRTTRIYYLLDSEGDDLVVGLKRQTLGQRGKWGKLALLNRASLTKYRLTPEDQAILAALRGTTSQGDRDMRGSYERPFDPADPLRLDLVLTRSLLPGMIATGRCHVEDPDSRDAEPGTEALYLDGGGPVRFVVRSDPDAESLVLMAELRRGAEAEVLWSGGAETVPVLLGGEHVALGSRVFALETLADLALARTLLSRGPLQAPAGREDIFLRRFIQLPGARHIEDAALVDPMAQPMQPRFLLEDPETGGKQALVGKIEFDYGDGDLARPAMVSSHFAHGGRLRPRDHAAESARLAQLGELGIVIETVEPGAQADQEGDARVPRSGIDMRILALIESGWEVFCASLPVHRGSTPSFRISSDKDWFEVEGAVEFGDEILELPELLRRRGARSGSSLMRLGDGSMGILASAWLDKWEGLLNLAEVVDGKVRLRSTQTWLLDAMLREHEGKLDVDQTFTEARQALRGHETVKPSRTPRGFGGKLRAYQREGLGWLLFLHELGLGGCLADEMGLGKTVQVLALLAQLRKQKSHPGRPSLVVAPRSLLDNWQREAERFCPELRTLIFFGSQRFEQHGASLEAGFCDYDIVLITYGTLRRDIEKLHELRFHYAILDEAQTIKNDRAQVSKAVRLLDADHRLAMTGTPMENHLGEIWSLFEFLNPGMLGRSKVFKDLASSATVAGGPPATEFLEALSAALRPFLLRRTKDEVLDDLPAKAEQVLHVELGTAQRRKYDELRDYYRERLLGRVDMEQLGGGFGKQQMVVLEALLRLRQAACHVGLITKDLADAESAKFEALLPMLDELLEGDHKALVFSQFTGLLALLKPHLDARGIRYEYLDGKTRKRQECVDRFQTDPECRLFLISLKAGGVGLNLTAADYVFLLDPWWNPAAEGQAIDRTHRIGQKKKVFAYRLIAKDTVEERVAELQAEKRALVDAVLAGSGGGLQKLSVQDVERLLQ